MADCSGFLQPLNLQCILVNMFAGDINIFIFIAIIAIAIIAATFRMVNSITLIMFVLFSIVMSNYVHDTIFYLVIVLLGLLIGFIISQQVKK